jgi:hypothetical protein
LDLGLGLLDLGLGERDLGVGAPELGVGVLRLTHEGSHEVFEPVDPLFDRGFGHDGSAFRRF